MEAFMEHKVLFCRQAGRQVDRQADRQAGTVSSWKGPSS